MPPKIAREPGTTVHAQIEDWLAGAIAVGRLAPGDRLPAEQDLAVWFGVSRMTLRHALGELARRGLVTRAVGRGGGTFIAEPKLEQDLTTLAGFSEQLRRHGMTPGARVLAAAEHPAGPTTAAALQIAEEDPVYAIRRIRLADGRPLVLEHSQFPAAVFPGMLRCRLEGSLYELLEVRYGQRPHRRPGAPRAGDRQRPRGRGAGRGRGGAAHAGGADRLLRARGSRWSSPATCSAATGPAWSSGPRSWPASCSQHPASRGPRTPERTSRGWAHVG